jgi:2-hydroxychromene-2-carboxylate isomerase
MLFEARIYFDFADPAVWRLYRFLVAAAGAGAELRTEWRPFAVDGSGSNRGLSSYEAVRAADHDRHGAYLQALLMATHLSGADPDDSATHAAAAKAAGIAPDIVATPEAWGEAVAESTAEARKLGVTEVPSLYRHGPVARVALSGAAEEGDVLARLAMIVGILEDDGIWEVSKP